MKAEFYIERAADNELLSRLERREYCYILASRCSGKSSLIHSTIKQLQAKHIRCVHLALGNFGRKMQRAQWYLSFLEHLTAGLGFPFKKDERWAEIRDASSCAKRVFLDFEERILVHIKEPIVIFVDELEELLLHESLSEEFLGQIRQCFNRRRQQEAYNNLTFCLVGSATARTLAPEASQSPFSIAQRIELPDLTEQETRSLCRDWANHAGNGEWPSAICQRIYYWTFGHPSLTQQLCRNFANAPKHGVHQIDQLCEELFFSIDTAIQNESLEAVDRALDQSAAEGKGRLSDVLTLYVRLRLSFRKRLGFSESDDAAARLVLSGLARVKRAQTWRQRIPVPIFRKPQVPLQFIRLRNRIFEERFDREWIWRNWPGKYQALKIATNAGIATALLLALVIGLTSAAFLYWSHRHLVQDNKGLMQNLEDKSREAAYLSGTTAQLQEKLKGYEQLKDQFEIIKSNNSLLSANLSTKRFEAQTLTTNLDSTKLALQEAQSARNTALQLTNLLNWKFEQEKQKGEGLKSALAEEQERNAQLSGTNATLKAQVASSQAALASANRNLDAQSNTNAVLAAQREQLLSKLTLAQSTTTELETRYAVLSNELQGFKTRASLAEGRLAQTRLDNQDATNALLAVSLRLAEVSNEVARATASLVDERQLRTQLERQALAQQTNLALASNQLVEATSTATQSGLALRNLTERYSAATNDVARLTALLDGYTKSKNSQALQIFNLETNANALSTRLSELQSQAVQNSITISNLTKLKLAGELEISRLRGLPGNQSLKPPLSTIQSEDIKAKEILLQP